jgi:superfamily II DNA/RNA helicase|tara:strand:- start:4400 stop:5860 length:1461 start_codon:yes stop_codon:yes gene_type:complete
VPEHEQSFTKYILYVNRQENVTNTFQEIGVPLPFINVLNSRGIIIPSPIQFATIKDSMDGKDLCGRAPTGSGKTIAFGIPIITKIPKARPKKPTGLILAPTRELAEQISVELKDLAFTGNRTILTVYGGVSIKKQINRLNKGVDILVACPGRLNDLLRQKVLDLNQVSFVVVDEADRMADMGFLPEVKKIIHQTMKDRQTILFSATLDGAVASLTKEFQKNPIRHEIGISTPDMEKMEHYFWKVNRDDRIVIAINLIMEAGKTIIFTRTRHGAERAAKQLKKEGIDAVALHGGKTQNQRDRALAAFTSGKAFALVATDVAARGIHVDGIDCVLHFDPPEDSKAYVHRSGRTARAGAKGKVVCFVDKAQHKFINVLQRDLKFKIPLTEPIEINNISSDKIIKNEQAYKDNPKIKDSNGIEQPKKKIRTRNRNQNDNTKIASNIFTKSKKGKIRKKKSLAQPRSQQNSFVKGKLKISRKKRISLSRKK